MDTIQGLSYKEVEARKKAGKQNYNNKSASKTYKKIIADNLFTLFNLINVVLAVLIAITGEYENMLFLGVMFWNLVIGIFQEIKAKRTLDKIALVVRSNVHVIREGKEETITPEEVVVDDVIMIQSGSQIVSDGILLSGCIEVDESLLSGESEAVVKEKGDFLYSGSFVVSSQGIYQVSHVGKENYASKMVESAQKMEKYPSQLRDSLNKIIKIIGITIIPIGIMLYLKQRYVLFYGFEESILSTSAALIGMIPEGLVILTSIALAVGVLNLARRKTLVQELYCLETLARVDVLCLDKTGTITEGALQVVEVIAEKKEYLKEVMQEMLYYLKADNVTSKALHAYFEEKKTEVEKVIHFSSIRKYSGIIKKDTCYYMGAYEFLIKDKKESDLEKIKEWAKLGYRIISVVEENELLGFILLSDKIREDAQETLTYFKKQDVELKILSGDHPVTVYEVAKRAGLDAYKEVIDLSKVKEDLDKVIKHKIFGRVSPWQKKKMIEILKKQGHCVGMSGDGVNDVLAFKEADISIAMASGSDMAKYSANLVLLNNSFESLPYVLNEGRRVINNIQKVATLFLTKTIFSYIMSLLTLIHSFPYPFQPIHLTFMSALCIGVPSFFLALEPNYRRVKDDFLENIVKVSLPSAIGAVLCVIYVYECAKYFHYDDMLVTQLSLIAICFNAYIVLVKCAYPFTKLRIVLLIGVFMALLLGFNIGHVFISIEEIIFAQVWKHCLVFLIILLLIPKLGGRFISYLYELRERKMCYDEDK